jgi:hypothetical protein
MGQDENVEFFMSASAYAGDEQYITRKARLVMRKARVWMTGVGRYTLESQRFCSYTAPDASFPLHHHHNAHKP